MRERMMEDATGTKQVGLEASCIWKAKARQRRNGQATASPSTSLTSGSAYRAYRMQFGCIDSLADGRPGQEDMMKSSAVDGRSFDVY